MSKKIELKNVDEFKEYYANHTRSEIAARFGLSIGKVDTLKNELNLPLKTFKYKNLNLEFTQEQMNILTGSMLGDGYLSLVKRQGQKNSMYAEVHSEKQYGLLEWKMNKLKPFSKDIKISKTIGRQCNNGKVTNDYSKTLTSCRLETIVHPTLTCLENKWYLRECNGKYTLQKNGRRIKKIPEDLILNEQIIATWYFDDGSNNPKHRQAIFNTQSFTFEECYLLSEKLKQIGINCGVVKNRNQPIIQTRTSSYLDLIEMVKKYLPSECVAYKVDLSKYKPADLSTRFAKKGITQRKIDALEI